MGGLNFSDNTVCSMALLAVFLPFLSFTVIWCMGKRRAAWIAIPAISLGFLISSAIFLQIWNNREIHLQTDWFSIGNTVFTAGIFLNNLSVLMLLLVSGIAMLVHIYSTIYMKGDPGIQKYWAYLSLFCFSMLGLVISDSLLMIYMFWELVGFSSFLLIGFWHTRSAASQAAKKAFIVNRIGDIGFLCGLMVIYLQFGTFDLVQLFGDQGLVNSAVIRDGLWIGAAGQMPAIWLSFAGLVFFAGAMAKSAQFPLHSWLPDAMEGPTSISSLIHAATMVAAGVFLLARIYPLLDPLTLNIIAGTGAFTALMAATIALTQNDIKRILAYSTISQLGFMIMAMGIGAYSESIFHLTTHAFFKCLLFLAAGAVIHQLHHFRHHHHLEFDHQDIRFMGGLHRQMPIACITMCIGGASLAGLPLTSGYLSKDALLVTSFEWAADQGGAALIVPVAATITSWFTVFYIARLIFKVFWGKPKHNGLHDATRAMSRTLIILALCSTFLIFSPNPFSYGSTWVLQGFIHADIPKIDRFHIVIPLIVSSISMILIYMTWIMYVKKEAKMFTETTFFYRFTRKAWYFNEAADLMIVRPVKGLADLSRLFDRHIIDRIVDIAGYMVRILSEISRWFDRHVIDRMVNDFAGTAKKTGDLARKFQTGKLQHYLITVFTVVIIFAILAYLI